MATRDLAVGMIFLLQTVIGSLGSFSLLYNDLFISFTGYRLRPTDLIVNNLIVSNFSVLFFSGLPYAISSFEWYHVFSDFGCRFFLYVCGVGRGVSVGTTCLLSVIQAITISPMISRWVELKLKAPKYIVPSMFLYWVLQLLINVIFPIFICSDFSNSSKTNRKNFAVCSACHDKTNDLLYATLLTSPDDLCFVLMLWACGFMVFILHRHKQRVQHIHRTHISSQTSPESRATKAILLLVSTFVSLSMFSCIFHIF